MGRALKKIDRRAFFALLTAAAVSGFIVICTLGQTVQRQRAAAKTEEIYRTPEELGDVYLVREYNGRIGVFRDGGDVPYRIIDYDISLLSDMDREMIAGGVVMTSDEELRQFIEDIAT
ncbi:MAG: hypothetical protein IJ874_08630 [Ruminococcus sp.]|nr:hypothetical protein [Ruminococcus sp.]